MKKQNLKIGKGQLINLVNRVSLGEIPENLLYDRLRDGRIIGLLVEDIIESEFNGITRVKGKGSAFDLIKTDTTPMEKIQCKSYNKGRINIAPSSMIGKGRKFNKALFYDYVAKIDIWILANVSKFPSISLISLRTADLLRLATITDSGATIAPKIIN